MELSIGVREGTWGLAAVGAVLAAQKTDGVNG